MVIYTHLVFIEFFFKVMRSEKGRLEHEQNTMKEKIKENLDKIRLNKQLPYLVANVIEVSWNMEIESLKKKLT